VLLLAVALVGLVLVALCLGRFSVNPADVIGAIGTKITGTPGNEAMENVLFVLRIPRVLAAMLVGAALSLSGAVYQNIFRNPLVSPDILGVSSGASVGAAAAILLGFGTWATQGFAFLGGMLAVAIAVILPRLMRNSSNMMLVLSGIITSGFMSSALGIMKFIAEETTELSAIVFWQMGSFASIRMDDVAAISPIFLICLALLLALAWRINILSFGEIEARTLGMNVKALRTLTVVCASLLTASSVSISGTIGWIGLVIPHLSRLIIGSDNTKMLPVTVLLGALFALVIDTIARALTTVEIPLSILTGIIGAPFYAWLLYKQKAKVA